MTVSINLVKGNELHYHYEGQANAQSCYVELDCEQEVLTATYNSEIGNAVPFSFWHGHDQRWCIPCLNAPAANNLLQSIQPIAERVISGYESIWDGNNFIAKFTDDAQAAIEEIGALCSGDNFDFETDLFSEEEQLS
jgi:hypothetical protein